MRRKKRKKNTHAIEGMRNEIGTWVYIGWVFWWERKSVREKGIVRGSRNWEIISRGVTFAERLFLVFCLYFMHWSIWPRVFFSFFFSIPASRRKNWKNTANLQKRLKGNMRFSRFSLFKITIVHIINFHHVHYY